MPSFRVWALWLAPLPFLLGVALIAVAFWKNDADFLLGRFTTQQAVLHDPGPPHHGRGRPRYYPSFRLANGQLLQLSNPLVADELPAPQQTLDLRCSASRPTVCKLPGMPILDPLFYAIALAWVAFAITLTGLLWRRARQLVQAER